VTRPLRAFRAFPLLAALMLALAALSACDADGGPAASVGDVEITHDQVQSDIGAFTFLAGLSNTPCGSAAEGESQDAACARLALANEIQEEIVKAYALEHDLVVDEADVAAAIAQLEEGVGGPGELDARLEENGLTRPSLETLATRFLLFDVVQEAVVAEELGEEDLQAAYEASKAQFTTVEVSHILLETRREAEVVAARATMRNFGRLARERSTDQGSAENDGSLGSYSEAQFRQTFDQTFFEAALSLRPGEISGVVETQFGFHVIELVRRDVAPFEDVRDQLSAQQGPQVFGEWLRGRYAAFDIEVNPRYGRLDESTGEVLPIRSTATGAGATGQAPTSPAP
jgi:foldase protein PrsA